MQKPSGLPTKALVGLIVLTLIWSYNWVVMKTALRYIGAFDFSALRCVFGALVLFAVLRIRGVPLPPPPIMPTALVGILQIGGMVGLSQWALMSGGAGKVSVLVYTMPFWMILLSALIFGEKIHRIQLFAVIVAAVGIILVLQPWTLGGSWQSSTLAMASGLCWAMSAIAAKQIYARFPHVELLSLTTWQMTIGALLMVVIALIVPQRPIEWNGYVVFAIAYNAVLGTALGWTLWLYLLKALPAAVAGLSMLAIPACSVIFAWIILGEMPNLSDDAGIGLIIMALALVNLAQRRNTAS